MAAWLLHQNVESEILYVPKRSQYIVKIPFINTYYKDYFVKKEMPAEIRSIKRLLAQAIEQRSLEWVGKCSQLSKMVEVFYDRYLESRKIRKHDLVQTTLFKLGANYANDPIIDQAVGQEVDLTGYVAQVENMISNMAKLDSEKISLNRRLTDRAKTKKISPDAARLSIAKDWIRIINRFFLISTTNFYTACEVRHLDNGLYQQWLFINKQLQTIEASGKNEAFLGRWQDLKTRCRALAAFSREKLSEAPPCFYMEKIDNYLKKFLMYECKVLDSKEKNIIDAENNHADRVIQNNERALQEIREKYAILKAEASTLAREMFAASYPGTASAPSARN